MQGRGNKKKGYCLLPSDVVGRGTEKKSYCMLYFLLILTNFTDRFKPQTVKIKNEYYVLLTEL